MRNPLAMLAYDMNDERLSYGHGAPLRLRNEVRSASTRGRGPPASSSSPASPRWAGATAVTTRTTSSSGTASRSEPAARGNRMLPGVLHGCDGDEAPCDRLHLMSWKGKQSWTRTSTTTAGPPPRPWSGRSATSAGRGWSCRGRRTGSSGGGAPGAGRWSGSTATPTSGGGSRSTGGSPGTTRPTRSTTDRGGADPADRPELLRACPGGRFRPPASADAPRAPGGRDPGRPQRLGG